ncbi:MAG: FkbM family methyltransferase [Candidatus Cyclobacteriaceae bacterium M2_1C_046]
MFNLSAKNSPLFLVYYKYLYKPRPGSVSSFIDFFSRRNKNITVVQVGANDGFNHDPLHKFIKRDRWRGVLLEPQKEVFSTLKELHKRSTHIHTVNAAIDNQNGVKPVYKVNFSDSRWATGLTTFSKETIEKAVQSVYVLESARKEGVIVPEEVAARVREESISTINPEWLLKEYKVKQLTWLQIDTEGYDFEIIKMFNIPETKPKVILFEQYHLSPQDKKECYQLLKNNRYIVKEYGRDALAVKDPEPEYMPFLEDNKN